MLYGNMESLLNKFSTRDKILQLGTPKTLFHAEEVADTASNT